MFITSSLISTSLLTSPLLIRYDLSFAPEMSSLKKKVLQKVATTVHMEDINWRSFRI
jgi:hypothetical protein